MYCDHYNNTDKSQLPRKVGNQLMSYDLTIMGEDLDPIEQRMRDIFKCPICLDWTCNRNSCKNYK